MSRPGERVMQPSFGSAVYETLFEDENTAISIATEAVAACFSEFFPYLNLTQLIPIHNENGALEIEIIYRKSKETLTETLRIQTKTFSRSGEVIEEAN